MSLRHVRRLGLALTVGLAAAACQDGPATAPVESELAPELALDQLAAEAARDGDADNAAAFRDGALALRLGLQPSEIEVMIKNEKVIYQAFMVGVVRSNRNGERVLVRSLLAWTGDPRVTAILQVSSRSDQALFGHPADRSSLAETPGRARGTWADLANHMRWVATAGSADMELAGTGGPCPVQPSTAIQCVIAEYDLRINGNFVPARSGGEPGAEHVEIHTNADGVNGVVLSPAS